MKTFLTLFASAALTLSAAASAATPPTSLTEGFDNIGALSGWVSTGSIGTGSWYQGDLFWFDAQAGAGKSYIASSYAVGTNTPTLDFDAWLLTPEITLGGVTTLTFYTRNSPAHGSEDTLQVLFGSGTAPAGYTSPLLTLTAATYLDNWTQYTAQVSGNGTGRFAFHYAGNWETAGLIAIDSVSISAVPEPSTWLMLGLGLAGVGLVARRSRRAAAGAALAVAGLGMAPVALAGPSEQGLVVVRDAETGQLRAPTAEEYRALVPQTNSRQARGVSTAPQVSITASGARKLNVEDKAMYSVVTRDADGAVAETCVTGEKAASAAVDNNTRTAQINGGSRHEAQ